MVKIKKKLVINTGILTILFVFCIGPMIASFLDNSIDIDQTQSDSLHTSANYSNSGVILNDNNYIAVDVGYLYYNNYFYYNFSVTNSAQIDVLLMDADEYWDYDNGYSYSYSTIEFLETTGFGYKYVYSSDSYYVVFENDDINCQLTYDITTYPVSSVFPNIFGGFFMTIAIIITVSVIIGIIIIAVIVIAIRKNTRKVSTTTPYRSSSYQAQRTPTPSTPVYQQPPASSDSKPEPTKGVIGFCRYCGDKTEIDATFCPRCGSKL